MDCNQDCELIIGIHANGRGQLTRILNIAAERQKLGKQVIVITSSGDPKSVEKTEFINGVEVRTILPFYSVAGERDPDRLLKNWDASEKGVLYAPEMIRRQKLVRIFEELKPAAVVVEGFPFLLEKMELTVSALRNTQERLGLPTVFFASIRDIVGHEQVGWSEDGELYLPKISGEKNPSYRKMMENSKLFDHMLIHADPDIAESDIDLRGLPIPHHYTGLVVGDMPQSSLMPDNERPIIVSAGGGSYGEDFVYQAFDAMLQCRLPNPWHFIVGQKSRKGLIHEFAEIAASYGFPVQCDVAKMHSSNPKATIDRHREDFTRLLGRAWASVNNAGYNTVVEAMKIGARLLAIPASRREGEEIIVHTEQNMRAVIMAQHGLLRTIDPRALTSEGMARTLEKMAVQPAPNRFIDMNGARRSSEIITEVLRGFMAVRTAGFAREPAYMAAAND